MTLSIVSKITVYLCNQLRKKAQILPIYSRKNAYLWNQQEKSHICKELVMRKFHISKRNHENVRVMQIFCRNNLAQVKLNSIFLKFSYKKFLYTVNHDKQTNKKN